MGRSISASTAVASQHVSPPTNGYATEVFGSGQQVFITSTRSFVVPPGVTSVRVRVWGAGGTGTAQSGKTPGRSGSGGGFAMKTITGLTPRCICDDDGGIPRLRHQQFRRLRFSYRR